MHTAKASSISVAPARYVNRREIGFGTSTRADDGDYTEVYDDTVRHSTWSSFRSRVAKFVGAKWPDDIGS